MIGENIFKAEACQVCPSRVGGQLQSKYIFYICFVHQVVFVLVVQSNEERLYVKFDHNLTPSPASL
jgi:hypothetical protein